ncbi:MAG: site-2 protease family protein [Thermoanaerobaculia bacterium]
MFGRRIQLFTAFGIPIRIDTSWFVVALLISWSLADSYFPSSYPGHPTATYWAMGIAGALGLFASIIVHELAHALAARQYGLSIRGITLFIFGGVAEMDREPPSAQAEFFVAIAGPIASVFVAVSFFATSLVGMFAGWPSSASGVLFYLMFINFVLVVFNMIPAFPLDGGRVLRSALWSWKKDLRWATAVTSQIGSGFGVLLIGFGVFEVVYRQDFIGGMWLFLIGMFLRNAAKGSFRQLLLRRNLEGETVRRFMHPDPIAVPRAISVAELVEQYVYRYHYKLFPVVDEDRLLGCVTTHQVKELPREEWARQTVGSIATPCSPDNTVGPETDALEALGIMSRSGASRLMVVENERLVGIITLKDLLKFLALKVELENGGPNLTGSNRPG